MQGIVKYTIFDVSTDISQKRFKIETKLLYRTLIETHPRHFDWHYRRSLWTTLRGHSSAYCIVL